MNTKPSMQRFLTTDLYGITSDAHSLGRSNVEVTRQMIAVGIKIIQYREKDKQAREMYEECIAIRNLTRQADVMFIVNDRIDLALAVKADGVHIGQDDLPLAEVRRIVGDNMIIGLSTHLPCQAKAAEASGQVDYIGVGPIFSTATKTDAAQPVGIEFVQYVANHITLPFVVIGGIKIDNIAKVKQAGASVFAIVSEIVSAPNIGHAVHTLRAELGASKS